MLMEYTGTHPLERKRYAKCLQVCRKALSKIVACNDMLISIIHHGSAKPTRAVEFLQDQNGETELQKPDTGGEPPQSRTDDDDLFIDAFLHACNPNRSRTCLAVRSARA